MFCALSRPCYQDCLAESQRQLQYFSVQKYGKSNLLTLLYAHIDIYMEGIPRQIFRMDRFILMLIAPQCHKSMEQKDLSTNHDSTVPREYGPTHIGKNHSDTQCITRLLEQSQVEKRDCTKVPRVGNFQTTNTSNKRKTYPRFSVKYGVYCLHQESFHLHQAAG